MTRHALLLAVLPIAFAQAAEKPNPYLAQARVFYQGAEFKKCVDRLKQADKWDSSVREKAEVALYQGLCRFYLKKVTEAEADFVRALELDPSLELPAATSPKIVEVWKRARLVVPAPEPPPEPAAPPPPPTPASVVERPAPTPAPANAVEAPAPEPERRVPVLAITAGSVAVAATIAAASFGLLANSNDAAARSASFQVDAIASRGRAETFATVTNVSWGVAAAAVVTALVLLLLQR